MNRIILAALMWLVASAANAQNFPDYVNTSPVASSIQANDVLALVRGNETLKLDPTLIGGIPQPVINGQCLIGAGGVPIWGSCSGSGAAVSAVTNSDGTLTVTPTTGNVIAGLALGHANTWTAQQTFVAPVLGTPASINLTNATGTASGVTAGNVITNANLTGIVTSAGNTTAIANGGIPLAKLGGEVDGRCIVGAGGVWTALSCPGGGTGLTIGTSTISGGTTNRFLYDNAGVLGEAIIGSGLQFLSGTLSATGGGGGSGFGVDGGTTPQSVTGTTAISNATRLVKVSSGWASGTLTLPSIAALGNSDAAIAIVDAGFVSSGATLTVAVNAADSSGGIVGSAGNVASVGPFTNAGDGLVFRVSGTHTWTLESSSTLAAQTCAANQVFNSISTNSLGCVQLGFGNLTGIALAVQLPAADTATQGAAKLHNVGFSCGWIAAINPNKAVCGVVNQASTISAIVGRVADATGGTATVSVFKAPSGTSCSGGTVLHSGSFNANGTANTNQALTVTTASVSAGDVLCITTTGTTTWTSGSGIGTITVFLAPS